MPDSIVVSRSYDRLGQQISQTDAYSVTTFTYDNLNRQVRTSNGLGLVAGLGYNLRDWVIANTNANGVWFTNAYDALGRVRVRGYADSTHATADGKELWGYTAGWRSPTSYTNQIGKITTYGYDRLQQKTNEAVVGVYVNTFTYAPAGDLTELRDGLNQKTTWTYDLEGRVLTKKDNANATQFTYTYDANSRLLTRTTPQKGQTVYSYDNVGNLKLVNYPNSPDLTFNYNEHNRVTSDSVSGGMSVSYTYRPGGLLETENPTTWASAMTTLSYTAGLRTGLTLQQPVIGNLTHSYVYDAAKRLSTLAASPGTFTSVYPVDTVNPKPSRQVTRVSLPNTSHITNAFDAVGRLQSTVLKNSGGTVLNSHTYLVNKANQRTKQTWTDGGYVNYTYDNASELLTGSTFTAANVAVAGQNYGYGYNLAQNMTSRGDGSSTTSYTVNGLNQMTGNGSYTYSYDLNGNRTGKLQTGSVFYTYDDENQLVSAATDTSQTPAASRWKTEWTYDARGRMRTRLDYTWTTTWSLQATTRYLYDGRRVIQERNGSNLPLVSYVRGLDLSGSLEGAGGIGGLLARVAHSGANGATLTPAYYHADGNGNVTMLINAAQTSVANYKYDPFGRTITSSGTLAAANVYQFSSKELMTKSGFYYYGFRFYDPDTGRWPNRDPIQEHGGINLYGFVFNNPIIYSDARGLSYSDYTSAQPVSPQEKKCWDEASLSELLGVKNSRDAAEAAVSGAQYNGTRWNGPGDAVRHCVWNCEMTRRNSEASAKKFADAHETGVGPQFPQDEREMDLHNNDVGRQKGKCDPCKKKSCKELCEEALRNGELRTLPQNRWQ